MPKESTEDILIKRIEGGIRAIRGNRKTPQEAGIESILQRLKVHNEPMHEELLNRYNNAVKHHQIINK